MHFIRATIIAVGIADHDAMPSLPLYEEPTENLLDSDEVLDALLLYHAVMSSLCQFPES